MMQKGCTLEARTGDEYGGKIRTKGIGGSRSGRDQNRPKSLFSYTFQVPMLNSFILARAGSWVVVLSGE
jgi:hypothetical protein